MKPKTSTATTTTTTCPKTLGEKDQAEYPDTEGLGCMPFREGERIGFVRQVNGPAAKARPEFAATEYELEELTRMWVRTLLDLDFYCYATQSCGSSEWREMQYAGRRIGRLQKLLGQATVERITEDIVAELGERFNCFVWDAFLTQR